MRPTTTTMTNRYKMRPTMMMNHHDPAAKLLSFLQKHPRVAGRVYTRA